MPDKNLTDNEIIKALEWYISPITFNRREIYSAKVECSRELIENTLDLINRQKAEIERLKAYIQNNGSGWGLVSHLEFCKNLKAEAYKEVWQKLKKEMLVCGQVDVDEFFERLVGER